MDYVKCLPDNAILEYDREQRTFKVLEGHVYLDSRKEAVGPGSTYTWTDTQRLPWERLEGDHGWYYELISNLCPVCDLRPRMLNDYLCHLCRYGA